MVVADWLPVFVAVVAVVAYRTLSREWTNTDSFLWLLLITVVYRRNGKAILVTNRHGHHRRTLTISVNRLLSSLRSKFPATVTVIIVVGPDGGDC